MPTTDSDYNESSSSGTPKSYMDLDSPFSSPSQQVPNLTNYLNYLSVVEGAYLNGNEPYLRIVEQPQNNFRFRYKSEMVGTHGCLLGKSNGVNKTKVFPTVELVNYHGKALIRCRLSQDNNAKEHPHKLLDEEHNKDGKEVPEDGIYRVAFPGLGIIHTAKKDVTELLYAKYSKSQKNSNNKELRAQCEHEAKTINLNIVRLMFTAHDIATDKEICRPVFSEPIHNMKSAATNDLKICRMSLSHGRPSGGDDVYILVEKVNKKNIDIRFYELATDGSECWSAKAHFIQSDVHHQYAIVFRTPKYRDPEISSDVKVYIELVRPSDGRRSESKEFTYKAEYVFKQKKKRKANSSLSSLYSSSGDSLKSVNELPESVVLMQNNQGQNDCDMANMTMYSQAVQIPQQTGLTDLGFALYSSAIESENFLASNQAVINPLLSQPNVPETPSLRFPLPSEEFQKLLNENTDIPVEDKRRLVEFDWKEYFWSNDELNDSFGLKAENEHADIVSKLHNDSGRTMKKEVRNRPAGDSKTESNNPGSSGSAYGESSKEKKSNVNITIPANMKNSKYSASYKFEDGVKVKMLIKELCDAIKNGKNDGVKIEKITKLLDIRLSNGDTFLHMTLSNNKPTFEHMVKIIHQSRLEHLLNLKNDSHQTILHMAIINDCPGLVTFLVSKGCDPMIEDPEGNNIIHYAVMCHTCIRPLLTAIKQFKVSCNLNASNYEKQTPLHLAALYNSPSSAALLLSHGASYDERDCVGRTPLHLAVYDQNVEVIEEILKIVPDHDIDIMDGRGYTPLQVVCGSNHSSKTVQIVKMLLNKKADPYKLNINNQSAFKIANSAIKEIIRTYISSPDDDENADEDDEDEDDGDEDDDDTEDVKSEADEYESAEEEKVTLVELPLFIRDLARILDKNGAWKDLAIRLGYDDSAINWYKSTKSPTQSLLNQVKDFGDNVTSATLVRVLEAMGEDEAANIIKLHI